MPVRMTLLAENIKTGTEVLEYAISHGCAVEQYQGVDSPLAEKKRGPYKTKANGDGSKVRGGTFAIQRTFAGFQSGSKREKGFLAVKAVKKKLRRVEWEAELVGKGFTPPEAKSLVAGLVKSGALVRG